MANEFQLQKESLTEKLQVRRLVLPTLSACDITSGSVSLIELKIIIIVIIIVLNNDF